MIKLPAYIVGYNRKADRSCSIRLETQELTGEQLLELDKHYQAFGWFLFDENNISLKDIPEEEAEDKDKSPSKRLKAVIFILWKQSGSEGDFNAYYREKMEKLINFIKEKLD